jgi:hypothetical protein
MAKDRTQASRVSRFSASQKRRISTSKRSAGVGAKRSRWNPAEITAEVTLQNAVLDGELKAVEDFLSEQINEILGRGRPFSNKKREKTQ